MAKYFLPLLFVCSPWLQASQPDSLSLPAVFIEQDTLRLRITSYLRLGLYQLESGENDLALATLNKALRLDPENPRIFIGIGRCYLERRDSKLKILEILERLFARDYLSRAISYFSRAVELAPDNWEAHYWLASAYMENMASGDLERALEHMNRAYELGGMRRDIGLKLAVLHKALGDLDHAEEVLSQLVESEKGSVDPLANLELAKISIQRKRYNEALRYYWGGVKAVSTREEFKAYFEDVLPIASRKELESYANTGPRGAYQFFRFFWLGRDYELGLSPGMRLVQHYLRLQVADSLYRVPFRSRSPAILPSVAYFPEEGIPYDDRGIIYLRHGKPDQTLTQLGEGVHPNETWVYHRRTHDFILHFAALKGIHEYQLVNSLEAAVKSFSGQLSSTGYPRDPEEAYRVQWIRELYGSRMEIGRGVYFRLYNNPYDSFARMEEYENNAVDINLALNSESVLQLYPQRLDSYYDLVEFRGAQAQTSTLDFIAGVPGQEITYNTGENGYAYDISYQLVIFDREWRQISRLEKVEKYESRIDPHELVDRLVLGQGRVQLSPGDYYYFVKIQNGQAVGNYNGRIQIDSFAGDTLQGSQILTARDIFTAAADSSQFKRYNLEVQPNPSRIFHPTDKVFAYQEIYNLTPDREGNYKYRVTYTVTSVRRDRNVFGKLYDTFKFLLGAGPGEQHVVLEVDKTKSPVADRMVHEDVALDISDNPDGLYELSVRVEDLNHGGRAFQRNTRFIVRR